MCQLCAIVKNKTISSIEKCAKYGCNDCIRELIYNNEKSNDNLYHIALNITKYRFEFLCIGWVTHLIESLINNYGIDLMITKFCDFVLPYEYIYHIDGMKCRNFEGIKIIHEFGLFYNDIVINPSCKLIMETHKYSSYNHTSMIITGGEFDYDYLLYDCIPDSHYIYSKNHKDDFIGISILKSNIEKLIPEIIIGRHRIL